MSGLQGLTALVPLLVKVSLWILIPFALRPLLARWSAARRHLFLTLSLAGTVALPVLLVFAPTWQAPSWLPLPPAPTSIQAPPLMATDRRSQAPSSPARGLRAAPKAGPGRVLTSPPALMPIPFAAGSPGTATVSHHEPPPPEGRPFVEAWSTLSRRAPLPLASIALFGGWLLGALLMAARVGSSARRAFGIALRADPVADRSALETLRRAAGRLSRRALPELRESSETAVPFALAGAAMIVLPASWRGWSEDRLEVVLVHELAHLDRRDALALSVGRVATAVWWFHPLVHLLDAWARKECERATDDAVLLSGSRASDYADHLIAIGRSLTRPLPAGVSLMMSNSPNLKARLLSILKRDQPRQILTSRTAWGAAVLVFGAALALAGLRLAPSVEAQGLRGTGSSDAEAVAGDRDHDHGHDHGHDHHRDHSTGKGGPWQQGYEAHTSGRYDEAVAAFEKAAEEGIRPAVSTYNAACGYALSDRPEEALAALRRALELGLDDLELLVEDSDLDPLRADPRFQALVDGAFADAGETRDPIHHYRYRRTQETLEALREVGSEDPRAWASVGTALLTTRRLDEAIEALSNAVRFEREPGGTSRYNLACAYARAGRDREALAALRESIEAGYSDPSHMQQDPDLRSLRGSREFQDLVGLAEDLDLDRFRKAFWEREKSLASKVVGKFWKGHREEYSEEVWEPAVEFYRGFTAQNPRLGAGWFNLGHALHYSSRFEEAGEAFRKARSLGYRPATSTYNIACGLSMLERVDEAIAALEEAMDLGLKSHFDHDSDLDNLRSDKRFRALARKQELVHKHG